MGRLKLPNGVPVLFAFALPLPIRLWVMAFGLDAISLLAILLTSLGFLAGSDTATDATWLALLKSCVERIGAIPQFPRTQPPTSRPRPRGCRCDGGRTWPACLRRARLALLVSLLMLRLFEVALTSAMLASGWDAETVLDEDGELAEMPRVSMKTWLGWRLARWMSIPDMETRDS